MMKKFLMILVGTSLLLTACNTELSDTQDIKPSSSSFFDEDEDSSKDKVLWVNEDGTDCDVGDLAEGDKDCKKKKKKVTKKSTNNQAVKSNKPTKPIKQSKPKSKPSTKKSKKVIDKI